MLIDSLVLDCHWHPFPVTLIVDKVRESKKTCFDIFDLKCSETGHRDT